MAYKYFTKKLLEKSNEIDLASIVPEKQQRAKEMLNTNYGLPQIVDWIKESTNNFKRTDNYFIDLDQAIQRLVYKYYDSIGRANPFKGEIEVEEVKAQVRVPAEVTVQGIKTGKPDVSKAPEPKPEPTADDIRGVIRGLEIQAELDPDNPIYSEVIKGLRIQLEMMS